VPEAEGGGPVLALGDSILTGPEEGAFGVPPRSWAQWLAELLDLPFHTLAVPGATTPWIADVLLPRARADYALACVGVGTNDVRSLDWDPRSFAAALDRILDGRPPAGAKVGELNAIVRAAAGARPGSVTVVDLDDLRGWRRYFPDAVHPTAFGQLEIACRAAAALGLDGSPAALTSVQSGLRADARYALTRQVGHLARDQWRRLGERNV
jgi:hypothetical protein